MNKNDRDAQLSESTLHHLVTFRLGQQTYALPIEPIVQIIEMVTITPIPQVNHSVEGVINLRGAAVPVVNLRRHLGLPEAQRQLHTPIVLVQCGGRTVGLIVDQVSDVLDVGAGQIACPTDLLPDGLSDAPLLRGLIQSPVGAVLLLDLERLFSAEHARLVQTLATVPQSLVLEGDGKKELAVAAATPEHVEVKA
jgi:purine-binding chemotaxis protein CheW